LSVDSQGQRLPDQRLTEKGMTVIPENRTYPGSPVVIRAKSLIPGQFENFNPINICQNIHVAAQELGQSCSRSFGKLEDDTFNFWLS